MSIQVSLGTRGETLLNRWLQLDNNIIGLFILALAAFDWIAFYNEINHIGLYFSLGVYKVKFLSTLSLLLSAVYLTVAAIILVSLKRPVSRSVRSHLA
jgi:hypothetical protein